MTCDNKKVSLDQNKDSANRIIHLDLGLNQYGVADRMMMSGYLFLHKNFLTILRKLYQTFIFNKAFKYKHSYEKIYILTNKATLLNNTSLVSSSSNCNAET